MNRRSGWKFAVPPFEKTAAQSVLAVAFVFVGTTACDGNQTHPMRDSFMPGDPTPLDCVPNLNGMLESQELTPALGVPVSLLVSPVGTPRDVNLVGAVIDEQRVWDMSLDFADDQLARIEAAPLADQWFEASFPEAEFVAPLDPAGETMGAYRHDDDALWLYGLASVAEEPAAGQTLIVYEAPVALYRFPIEVGGQWVSVGESRNAMLRGLPYAGRDVYEVSVVSAGRLELPDLAFQQVHRVDLRLVAEPAVGEPRIVRQSSFLFECFGEVARATGPANVDEADFGVAAELRRLSLEM